MKHDANPEKYNYRASGCRQREKILMLIVAALYPVHLTLLDMKLCPAMSEIISVCNGSNWQGKKKRYIYSLFNKQIYKDAT